MLPPMWTCVMSTSRAASWIAAILTTIRIASRTASPYSPESMAWSRCESSTDVSTSSAIEDHRAVGRQLGSPGMECLLERDVVQDEDRNRDAVKDLVDHRAERDDLVDLVEQDRDGAGAADPRVHEDVAPGARALPLGQDHDAL